MLSCGIPSGDDDGVGRDQDEALRVMDQFGWGAEFLRVNADVLETYAACVDGAGVVAAQVRGGLTSVVPSSVCGCFRVLPLVSRPIGLAGRLFIPMRAWAWCRVFR